MKMGLLRSVIALAVAAAPLTQIIAQVQTNVPEPVPGAKAVTVEHIKVHGNSLEGNLEGDAVDREVIVFLPPGYAKNKKRRYPVVYAMATPSEPISGRMKSTSLKPSKGHSLKARMR